MGDQRSTVSLPGTMRHMDDNDIRHHVEAVVGHFGKKFPQEAEEYKAAVRQKIHRLHKESGMSRGGTSMLKALVPPKGMFAVPERFRYWWCVEQKRPPEEFSKWFETIKDEVYSALFACSPKLCINKNSQPTVRKDGTGL